MATKTEIKENEKRVLSKKHPPYFYLINFPLKDYNNSKQFTIHPKVVNISPKNYFDPPKYINLWALHCRIQVNTLGIFCRKIHQCAKIRDQLSSNTSNHDICICFLVSWKQSCIKLNDKMPHIPIIPISSLFYVTLYNLPFHTKNKVVQM